MTVPALPAASLLLLRDSAQGLEVYHVRRAGSMAFGAHATAFPGGRVDPSDDAVLTTAPDVASEVASEASPSGTLSPDLAAWATRLGLRERPVDSPAAPAASDASPTLDGPGMAAHPASPAPEAAAARFLAAVVRETFEETGVLLARTAAGEAVDPEPVRTLALRRDAVERHEQDFAALLAAHGLRADVSGLRAWQRWITPVSVPRRYDTVFFLVAVPEGQEPERLTTEAAHHGWAAPDALLGQFRAGEVNLMTPTWAQLRALTGVRSVADALALGAAVGPVPVVQLDPDRAPEARGMEFAHADEYLADVREFRARAAVEETSDNIL